MALGGTVSAVVGGVATGFGVEVCCSEKRGEGVVIAAAKVVVGWGERVDVEVTGTGDVSVGSWWEDVCTGS